MSSPFAYAVTAVVDNRVMVNNQRAAATELAFVAINTFLTDTLEEGRHPKVERAYRAVIRDLHKQAGRTE